MKRLRVNTDSGYDAYGVLVLLLVLVGGEDSLRTALDAWFALAIWSEAPAIGTLALIGVLLLLVALPFGLRRYRVACPAADEACHVLQAGIVALVGAVPVWLLLSMLGLIAEAWFSRAGHRQLGEAAFGLLAILGFAAAGCWSGWRFGVNGMLWGCLGALAVDASVVMVSGDAAPELLAGRGWIVGVGGLAAAIVGGRLGAERLRRAVPAADEAHRSRSARRTLPRLAAYGCGLILFFGFHSGFYPALRERLFASVPDHPVDVCADDQGHAYVLSSRETVLHPSGHAKVFVYDDRLNLQDIIRVRGDGGHRDFQHVAASSDGRLFVSDGEEVYALSEDGVLASLTSVGDMFGGDLLVVGDRLYVLRRGGIVYYDLDGNWLGRHRLPDTYARSNLAATSGGECAVCCEGTVYYVRGSERRDLALQVRRDDLGHDRMLWHDGAGPVLIHDRSELWGGALCVTGFDGEGAVVRDTALPGSLSLVWTATPFAFTSSVAKVNGKLCALNLAPLHVHVLDSDLALARDVNLCGNVLTSAAVKLEDPLSRAYSALGVLTFIFPLTSGQVVHLIPSMVLTLGALVLLHVMLRRFYQREDGSGRTGTHLLAYLLPWVAVLILVLKASGDVFGETGRPAGRPGR